MFCNLMNARNPLKAPKMGKWRWNFETWSSFFFAVATNLSTFCFVCDSLFFFFFLPNSQLFFPVTEHTFSFPCGGDACLLISERLTIQTYGSFIAPLLCQRLCEWWFHCCDSLLFFPLFFFFLSFCESVWLITWIISDCDKLQCASSQEAKTRSLI